MDIIPPDLVVMRSQAWSDYELLDSGNGRKLERYGPYTIARPAPQAVWQPALEENRWKEAHAAYQAAPGESGGRWVINQPGLPGEWEMGYKGLKFHVHVGASRHIGVFPEQAVHWDWMQGLIQKVRRSIHVLNLFGYSGIASLAATQAGARVSHVDASRKSIGMARENQALSGLEDRPIRWIVDDALKFTLREGRRRAAYEGIILDPPKFGRGPKGEVWEFFDLFPRLLQACRAVLSAQPLFVVITAYAIQASALSLYYSLEETMQGLGGETSCGELALVEKSAGRLLSTAIFARWEATGI